MATVEKVYQRVAGSDEERAAFAQAARTPEGLAASPTPARVGEAAPLRPTLSRRRFAQLAVSAGVAAAFGRSLTAWASEDPATADAQAPGAAWVNSDVIGSVTADDEIRPQDDFHAAVNQAWLSETHETTSLQASSFDERGLEVQEQILALIQGEAQEGYEGQLVQRLYADVSDMEARDARGVEPLQPFVDAIRAIETTDDLTAYLAGDENRVAAGPLSVSVMGDLKDSRHNMVFVEHADLSLVDSAEYAERTAQGTLYEQAVRALLEAELPRLGFTSDEAASVADDLLAFESELADACITTADTAALPNKYEYVYNPYALDELEAAAPAFPVAQILQDYVDEGISTFVVSEPSWLERMGELYDDDHLAGLKAQLLWQTLVAADALLDQQSYDNYLAYTATRAGLESYDLPVETYAYNYVSSALSMAVARMYADAHVTPETRQDVAGVVDELQAAFRARLETCEWLGDETRAYALEKLDAMKVRVACPDDWSLYDYAGCVFPEGAGPVDELVAIRADRHAKRLRLALSDNDGNVWPEDTYAPQTVNAFYYPLDNSINICAGILGGVFYDASAAREERLGGIGTVVGHEITHGFDSNTGSLYDKDGSLANWWTDEDRAAFEERTDAVDAYYTSIEILPDTYLTPGKTVGETVADLGGVACALDIAAADPSFDHAAFFEAYARTWRCQEEQGVAAYVASIDVHAPSYLRTNVTLQQFQQFHDTYGVAEGDGMWLAPEERLSVW